MDDERDINRLLRQFQKEEAQRDPRQVIKAKEEEDAKRFIPLGELKDESGQLQQRSNIPLDEFLYKHFLAETSGRSGIEHPVATYGLQKGKRAIGDYALMPDTVEEIMRRNPDAEVTKDLKKVNKKDREFALRSDDRRQLELARLLGEHVLKRQGGDEARAHYAMETGHNLYPEDISRRELKDSNRLARIAEFEKLGKIDKFRQLHNLLNNRQISGKKLP